MSRVYLSPAQIAYLRGLDHEKRLADKALEAALRGIVRGTAPSDDGGVSYELDAPLPFVETIAAPQDGQV